MNNTDYILNHKLPELLGLELGWDGYRGVPLDWGVAGVIHYIVTRYCTMHGLVTNVCPGNDGTAQVEWHNKNRHIEINVDLDGMMDFSMNNNSICVEFSTYSFEELDLDRMLRILMGNTNNEPN